MSEGENAASKAADGKAIEKQLVATRMQLSKLSDRIDQQGRIFNGIFSSISDFAYAFDREGRFVFVNRALLDLWGLKLENAVGKTFFELPYPEELAAQLQRQIEHVFETGENVIDETPYTNPEGKLGYYEYIFCPVRDVDDRIEFVAGSTRDITKRKLTEQQLERSEEQYRTLFNSIDEGFCIAEVLFDEDDKAIDYRFLEVNPSFMKQSGLDNVVGKTVRGDLVPDQEEFWFETYGRVAVTGEPAKFEHFTEPLNRWFEVYAFRIGNPEEKKIALIFTDITARKTAEAEIKQLSERNRDILESIGESFFALDDEWRFTYANRQAERVLARDPGELIGKVLWEEYPGLIGSEFELVYRRVAEQGVTLQVTNYYPDHDRWYEVNCYPAGSGITVYFRDVSDRVRADEKLQEADRRKDEFLATLAHELRNPLAPIRSGLEVLRNADADMEVHGKTLDMIERQTNQIVHLVDDLLDVSRITQGKIKLRKERFPLRQAVEMAIETSQSEIDNSGNELIVTLPSKPVYLEADLVRTAQIFLNVLNNAAKFSPPGGTIRLVAERTSDEAVISIRDEGRGIPTESMPKIFDIFGQVETAERPDRGGLGIGLSVVKQLAEMHGGSVEARSEGVGKGTEFIIRLPLAAAPEAASDRQAGNERVKAPARSRKVLVVDDNRDAADMLEMLLQLEGHDVRKTFEGHSALDIAREFEPEVCLLDIGLPGMSGHELAGKIRQLLPEALLISVSGWGQEPDLQRSREAGFDHHLVKPVEFKTLLSLIASKAGIDR